MRNAGWRGLIWILVFSLAGISPAGASAPAHPAALQSNTLTLTAPTGCPGGSCAAGQRFNLSFDFELGGYDAAVSPNVKMCVYAPANWHVEADASGPVLGVLTGVSYDVVNNCTEDTAPPDGYERVLARQATISGTTVSDIVNMALSTGASASGNGRFIARLFVYDSSASFTQKVQALAPVFSITPPAGQVFVANDAAACGSASPCYLNSGDDLQAGLGTALRDAVQAAVDNATIVVLGNYNIKSSTVLVDRPVTLTGINDARITFSGSGPCSNAMLSLQDEVTLRGLNINDGACASPNRNLVDVYSSKSVIIEANDLTGGDNAIFIRDNSGSVRVRLNHISGNGGYAIYSEGDSSGGALEVTANNLHANRAGNPVLCSTAENVVVANRRTNHNYWGGFVPSQAATHCTLAPGKRLGAPITLRGGGPGVNAQLVDVTTDKKYAFNNQIAFRRSGGSNFSLFIVDHGFLSSAGAPFTTAAGEDSPSPCSNYWDVFLPDGSSPDGALELFLKYDQITACKSAIDSTQFCGQTTASKYPLYWFDPATGATDGWNTTGQRPGNLTTGEGQVTSCSTAASEIQVSIDNSGRPALGADLGYTPLMVAVPVLRTFLPLASNKAINVTWTTNLEPDVTGFYVLRGEARDNLSQHSDFIPRRGTALTGVITPAYSFLDDNLENGVVYYYRLQIVRSDGGSVYSQIEELSANIATITPTFTISPTRTATQPRPTNTPRPTLVPTQRPTSLPTLSATPRTATLTATRLILNTVTPTSAEETQATPGPGTGTESPGTPVATLESLTPSPAASITVTSTVAGQNSGQEAMPWISLLIGLLAGLAAVAAAGGWWYLRR